MKKIIIWVVAAAALLGAGGVCTFTSCDTGDGPGGKSIALDEQQGMINAGKGGRATYKITTNIADENRFGVTWYTSQDGKTVTLTPKGVTSDGGYLQNPGWLYISASEEVVQGEYFFRVTCDGATSAVAKLTVGGTVDEMLNVTVDEQRGTITAGKRGQATFAVTTRNIENGSWVNVRWYDNPEGTGNGSGNPYGMDYRGYPDVTEYPDVTIENNAATVTMTTDEFTTAGEFFFKVVVNNKLYSNVAKLTVLPQPEFSIAIEVVGDGTTRASVRGATVEKTVEGATVDLNAWADEEHVFVRWTALSGGITIMPDATASVASFTMPAADVSLRAEFETTLTTGISLDRDAITMTEGTSETLIATVSPETARNKDVRWSSGKESVAAVGQHDGVITAVAPGTTTITAVSSGNENIKATCVVTVTEAVSMIIAGTEWATRNVDLAGRFVTRAEEYGEYFTLAEAQAACPAGWRLPSWSEFETLVAAAGSSGYRGGFINGVAGARLGNADGAIFLPAAGYVDTSWGDMVKGTNGYYLSSTPSTTSEGYACCLNFAHGNVSDTPSNADLQDSYSVRCVRDK
ncbi:MAG: Ig-like domain-containing protein [Alistipes sp.]|jgi:uncharacterized protein (TIGR02145 family)|nr:Ig-like domain-containing protein [Alistipes sp.]